MGEGKATAGLSYWGLSGEPATPPSLPPLKLWATAAWAPPAAWLVLQLALPSRALDGYWGSYGWLSSSSVLGLQRAGHGH